MSMSDIGGGGGSEPTTELSVTITSRVSRRRKSIVWEDFDLINKDGVAIATCKHCNQSLSARSSSGTSHLHKHLKRCPKRLRQDMTQQLLEAAFNNHKVRSSKDVNHQFDQERSREDLARMVILDEFPLNHVEQPAFKNFLESLQPQFKLLSQATVKADCITIYEREKKKVELLLAEIPGRISLAIDMWSSNPTSGYMCLTARFIDREWRLCKRILNIKMIPCLYTWKDLSDAILSSLDEWNIRKKLFSITMDDSTDNEIASQLIIHLNEMFPLAAKLSHVRCCVRILNMIAKEGLEEIHDALHRIREAVKYVKTSQPCMEKFDEIAKQIKIGRKKRLYLDVPTRWNSTYLMLESVLGFEDVFLHLEACDSNFREAPTEDDWSKAALICKLLKLFYDAVSTFSSTKNHTANVYFHEVCKIQMHLIKECNSSHTCIGSMISRMQTMFDKYWNSCFLVLSIAVVLDPRYKMHVVRYCFQKIYGSSDTTDLHIQHVQDAIQRLYEAYDLSSSFDVADKIHGSFGDIDIKGSFPQSASSEKFDYMQEFHEFMMEVEKSQQSKSELEQYLEEKVHDPIDDIDILSFWKLNQSKYPKLSRMACDVLAIPISSVASKSAFSVDGHLDQYRSTMHPKIVEVMICAQDWLRGVHVEDSNSDTFVANDDGGGDYDNIGDKDKD